MRATAWTIAALAVAAIAGCGGGATGTTATVDRAADARAAQAAVLTLVDFPKGWTEQDAEAGDQTGVLSCPSLAPFAARRTAKRDSPSFAHGDATYTSQTVIVFPDAATATRAEAAAGTKATRGCLQDRVAGGLKQGTENPDVVTRSGNGELTVAAVGDEVRAARISTVITASKLDFEATYDVVFIRVGRGLTALAFASATGPFDAALRDRLAHDAASRLASALEP